MRCNEYGEDVESPQVRTLFALDSGRAIVLGPNCEFIRTESVSSSSTLRLQQDIQAVESYPDTTRILQLQKNAIRSFKAFASSVQLIDLSSNQITNLASFAFPQSVTELVLDGNTIERFSASNFPARLKALSLRQTSLQSLANLRFPESLTLLSLDESSKLSDLTGLVLPSRLETFTAAQSPIQSVSGVRFPSTLTTVTLGGGAPITTFDVHASDLPVLQAAKLSIIGGTRISKCSNNRGRVTTLQSTYTVCVYEDDAFGQPGTGSSTGSSSVQSAFGSSSIDADDSSGSTSSSISDWSSADGKPSTATRSPSTNSSTDTPPTSGVDTTTDTSSSSQWSTPLVIVAVVTALLIGVIASVVYRRRRIKAKGDDHSSTTNTTTKTEGSSNLNGSQQLAHSKHPLVYDVRNDPLLLPYRVLYEDLTITAEIGQGGFGVVYRAKLDDRDVVVKRLVQNNRQHDAQASTSDALRRFMDEIRLSAVVEHPTIVAFVGVAWTTLLDLSLILEYLPNGDLYGHLRRHKQQLMWLEDGDSDDDTSASDQRLRCKASLAIDIVDALVYLHAWSPLPIVHRDLKARNVLLSSEFRAKLCDFGVSREAMLSETMTGGVGTTAWIAPEVLQGERYSEKADIYSLGMVLCEMDVCGHPYNHDLSLQEEMADAQIACLVSAGQLKPTLRADCPAVVRQLIMACVEYEAVRRPSASEVLAMLQKAVRR